ncbi:hypothetical protein [Pseudodesulfovibrio pelocollis]|uniref:hypothetical protein n=1 Tax=Pseudodesulfovibrio pelocollis TaxID=3051432 RepID=UPI00255B320D|nr:hypothetical protein [Pseudodesulfovibrio sp. SB368]
MSLALAVLLATTCPALAQDTTPLTTDDLVSLVGEVVVEEAAQADERVRKAREMYDEVMRRGTRQQQTEAGRELDRARERSGIAARNLDEARVKAIAEKSGRSPAEIRAMRDSGMGWGAIANETGVHPSVNAKGKAKGKGADAAKGRGAGKGRAASGNAVDLPPEATGKGKAKGKGSQ